MTRDEIIAKIVADREQQGLPATVIDASALDRLITIMRAVEVGSPAKRKAGAA
ncbi:MAG: hypothetical protein M3O98_03090 [Actinomycetota bacterium]|nr:hypothetical protein [Actinomycetota bacterium]